MSTFAEKYQTLADLIALLEAQGFKGEEDFGTQNEAKGFFLYREALNFCQKDLTTANLLKQLSMQGVTIVERNTELSANQLTVWSWVDEVWVDQVDTMFASKLASTSEEHLSG